MTDLTEKELKALVHLLDDDDRKILSHVEEQILSLGERIIPFLESEWEENFNPIVQTRIEELIHTVQFSSLTEKLKKWALGEQDLLEGMWLLATYQYPDLELASVEKELELIYYESWLQHKSDVNAYDQIKLLNDIIFNKLKFRSNRKNFHAPNNSMINAVLESKRGNPISLCVIYMLVARKLKMPVFGINLPNLFILTYKTEDLQFYINVFNRGIIFTKEDIDNYITNLHLSPRDLFYQPCSNVDILQRALRNLTVAFDKLGDHDKVEEIKSLLTIFIGLGTSSE